MKIEANVGDMVKVEFSSHGRDFEVNGEVKAIYPNAIRVDAAILNFKVINNVFVDPATCQVCGKTVSEVNLNMVDYDLDTCVTCERKIEILTEFRYVCRLLKKATHEEDVAWGEELMEEKYRLENDWAELA